MTTPQGRCAGCGYDRSTHDDAGRCPGQRGSFRAPPPTDPALWPEIIRRDVAARFAVIEQARAAYVPEAVRPPQVPARLPYGSGELAGYGGRQAVGLGRAAARRGWAVAAYYWRAADGTEGCAVKLRRDDLGAVATWKRPAGNIGAASGWSADVAYGWRLGTMPASVTHKTLLETISD